MKLPGLFVVCVLGSLARADTTDPFSYAHAHPRLDPFKYMHGFPPQEPDYSNVDVAQFAAKPLNPDISRSVEKLLDARGVGSGLLAESGDRMVFTWKITGTSQVWRQDGPNTWPVQLTGGEENTTVVAMAPNDSFVVVSRDVGGGENPGLFLTAGTGPLVEINRAAKVQSTVELVSDDSKSIIYRANDRDPASFAFYRYDVATKTKTLVFDEPGVWSIADHHGDVWLVEKHVGNVQTEIYQYDVAKKQLSPVIGVGENEQYEARFGAKPGQVLVLTNKLGEFTKLYSYDAGTLTAVGPAIEHDAEDLAIDDQRTRVYFSINKNGYRQLVVLDAKTWKRIDVKLPDGDQVTLAALTHSGRFAQISVAGADKLATSYVLDWRTKKLVAWRSPAAPETDPNKWTNADAESYLARDGVAIPMFVRRPAACVKPVTPCPVIVDFHGGPESQTTPQFSPAAEAFVEHGFIVVQPNVRGSAGYGKSWLHADDGAKRLDVITDIEDVAKFIRTSWALNGVAPKIGVMGGSYGGYSVLIAMTLFAGAYDAGAEQVGMSNLTTFLANTAPYRRALRIAEYGDPVKDKVALEKLSPITYVDRLKAPLLIFQGVNDPRVPMSEALQIHAAMQERHIDGDLILFPDEGHGSQKRANIVMTIGHELEFFERHLK